MWLAKQIISHFLHFTLLEVRARTPDWRRILIVASFFLSAISVYIFTSVLQREWGREPLPHVVQYVSAWGGLGNSCVHFTSLCAASTISATRWNFGRLDLPSGWEKSVRAAKLFQNKPVFAYLRVPVRTFPPLFATLTDFFVGWGGGREGIKSRSVWIFVTVNKILEMLLRPVFYILNYGRICSLPEAEPF